MFFFLGKLLSELVFPPASTIVLLLAAALIYRRRPGLARGLAVVAVATLYLLSSDYVSAALGSAIESRYPQVEPENAPVSDAIVVLGGYLHPRTASRPDTEFNDAGDRLWMGARLYRAGKAPLVLLTGGNVTFLGSRGVSEAVAAKELLELWGVPETAILVEAASQSTHQNALFSKPLLEARNARHLLLVTSAAHMPRAMAIFRHEGLNVTPIPTDYKTGWGEADALFRALPNPGALERSEAYLHEWMGIAAYRVRGWL